MPGCIPHVPASCSFPSQHQLYNSLFVLICSRFVVLPHILGLSHPFIQFAPKCSRKAFSPISMSSSLPRETTPAVTAGLAIAQVGHVLNCCLLAPNSSFYTQMLGLAACTPPFCFVPWLHFVNRGSQCQTTRQEEGKRSFSLSASCGLGGSPPPAFFTLAAAECFCSSN